MKFIVLIDRPRMGKGKSKYKGYFVEHRHIEDPVQRIFAHLHYLGNHSAQWKRWAKAERAMIDRYMPRLWRMVSSGIKSERI